MSRLLFYGNFGAANGFAGKAANFAGFVYHDAVFGCVYGEVARSNGAFAGALAHANLAYNHLAGFNCLTTKYFNP